MQIAGIIEWALRKKYSLSDAFQFFSWQCMPHGAKEVIYYELAGGVPQAKFKSGPRKGRWNYSTCIDRMTLRVTAPELLQHEHEYIEATGNCSECMGEGKTLASIGISGTTYRECKRCSGTGKHGSQETD